MDIDGSYDSSSSDSSDDELAELLMINMLYDYNQKLLKKEKDKKAYETSSSSLSREISTQDSLAHSIGTQEHCGRARGLGPCPSKVFRSPSHSYNGITSSAPSYRKLQNQVTRLKSQVDEQNKKIEEQNKKLEEQNKILEEQNTRFNAMMSFFMQNFQSRLPPDLALFQTSLVSDKESTHPVDPSSTNYAPKE